MSPLLLLLCLLFGLSLSSGRLSRLSVSRPIHRDDARVLLEHIGNQSLWISFGTPAGHLNHLLDLHHIAALDRLLVPTNDAIAVSEYEEPNASVHVSSKRSAWHPLGDCQLWWPLNNSELHIHDHIASHLSPLRLKQKAIVSCPAGPRRLTIVDQGAGTSSRRMEINLNSQGTSSAAMVVDFTLHLSNEDAQRDTHQVSFLLSADDDAGHVLGQATLFLRKHYATDETPVRYQVHPWANSLDGRDGLGFALAALVPNATSFVEIGVCKAQYAELILHTSGVQDYIGVDSWSTREADSYPDIANVKTHSQLDNLALAAERMSMFPTRAHLLRMDSLSAAALFRDSSVDVVYIDAMHHHAAVLADMTAWWAKLRPCGLLAGHDYLLDVIDGTIFTVRPAVLEFARQHRVMVLRTDDVDLPAYPTWMIFKPCSA